MTENKKSYAKVSGLTIKVDKVIKNSWTPKYGEKLTVQLGCVDDSTLPRKEVEHDGSIEVLRINNGQTVGRVPSELQGYFHRYLAKNGHITAEVTNTKFVNVDNNDRELFCDFILQGPSNTAIKRIINGLEQALKGPEFGHVTMVTREDIFCSYLHHAVSKAPDLEAKRKAMSKYPKRMRRQRSQGHGDTSELDPRCIYHENSTLERKRGADPTSCVATDHVPKQLTRKRSVSIVKPATTTTSQDKEKETKETSDMLPEELENDPLTRQIYESALEQGQEVDFTMRLMIIGCYGQGKSSLAKRLMGQSPDGVKSTNGIEVNICEILNDSLKWEQKKTEDVATECIKRLVSISKSNSSTSLKSLNTDDLMDIDKQEETPDLQNENEEDFIMKMDIELDSGDDFKIKTRSFDQQVTNKAKAKIEKDKLGSDQTKIAKKNIDSANVKRFLTEYRKSISFEKETLKEKTKTISIWDFGGQFVYYATHQLFHSRHAIYLLVFSLNESLEAPVTDDEKPKNVKPKTMKDYIKFWISSVHSFVGNRQGTEPTIILVGTKKDLLDSDVNIEQKFEDVRKLFDGSKMLYHLLPEHFAVSNLDESSDEFVKLCHCVNDLTQKQCQNNVIPARWIPLERKLKENCHLKIVDLKTVLKFNNENEVPIENEHQVDLFLRYHHARGTFFYFSDRDSSQVVLEPQYIVDAFKCLLTAERFCIVRPSLRESWHKLCDKAILDKQLLHDVWGRNEKVDFLKFEDILIFFLKKHRIIAEALKFEDNTKINTPPLSLGFFIVPSLLNKPDEGLIETFMKRKKYSQVSLVYIFENESVIPTLFYRLAAAGCGQWPLIEYLNVTMIFENAVLFRLSLNHAGLLKLDRNTLEILVIGLCPPHRVCSNDCDLFRRFIEMVIGQEFRKFSEDRSINEDHSRYTKSVRCYNKSHGIIGSKNIVDYESLTQSNKKRTGCPDHDNHYLRGNKILKEWYKAGLDTRFVPKRELSRAELSSISMMIEDNWQHLGIQLDFLKADVEQIDTTPNLTTSMKIFELLSQWDTREAENATLDVLVVAMNKCKKVLKFDHDLLRNLIDGLDT